MPTIHKHYVALNDSFELELPEGAEFLSLQVQNGDPVMWFRVNPDAPRVRKSYEVVGTGHFVRPLSRFLGTFQLSNGALVLHVFEV